MTERLSTYIIQGSGGVFIYESEWGHEYGDFFSLCACVICKVSQTLAPLVATHIHMRVCVHIQIVLVSFHKCA